jgi:uncharacterized membrane protein HdeD (DUF308 family)
VVSPCVRASRRGSRGLTSIRQKGDKVILLGIVLLIIGFIAKVAILWTIGIIVLVIGAVLAVMGALGREVGGRRHFF